MLEGAPGAGELIAADELPAGFVDVVAAALGATGPVCNWRWYVMHGR